jgi:hypothetical protein
MPNKALFSGLIVDENDQPVETALVGDEAMYVVNDYGFRRHIPSREVDREVLRRMTEQIKGHEDIVSEQTAKMLGQDDIFSKALIQNQLKNIDQQLDTVLNSGIPEEGRVYMGMMGFKIVINVHGEIVDIKQPGAMTGDEEE